VESATQPAGVRTHHFQVQDGTFQAVGRLASGDDGTLGALDDALDQAPVPGAFLAQGLGADALAIRNDLGDGIRTPARA
jgi:hypothetical protein